MRQFDDRESVRWMAAGFGFLAAGVLLAVMLVSLNSCATWRAPAIRSLQYAEAVAVIATESAKTVCVPAMLRCEKERIDNPCTYLEDCIISTEKARQSIESFIHGIEAGWAIVAASDADSALDSVAKILQAAGEVRSILSTWGIDVASELEKRGAK